MVKTRVKFAGASDMGRVRKNNEDAWHIDADRGIYLVVDGVGGHQAGEKAAEIAVERVKARLERQTGTTEQRIREAITVANNEIHRAAKTNPDWDGMACVLTVAVLENGSAVVGHVGDSRLYHLRGGDIRKVTHDHSPVGEREDSGELDEASAMRHPRRNEVYRDVGSEEHTPDDPNFIEIQHIDFEPDAAMLLCSDGLSDLVTAAQIREIVERHAGKPETATKELIETANRAGGKDNITIVLVQGEQFRTAAPAPAPVVERKRGGWALPVALALLAVAIAGFAAVEWQKSHPKETAPVVTGPKVWEVGPGQGTIAEAINQAKAGDRIVVAAGEYREQVVLKPGITIVSNPPRAAVLRAAPGTTGPAVVAEKVDSGRLSGFSIVADAQMPLSAGIVLTDSGVEIDDVEVSGAAVGVVIRSGGKPSLRGSLIRECTVGVLATGPVEPWISHNAIARNKKSGLVAAEGAHPALTGNVFERNRIELPPNMDMKPVREHNFFVGMPTAGGRGGAAATATTGGTKQ
jgi:serine/threonine protein phosphatase PrpC